MPKKIKNNALQKYEKANCILSVVLMAASLGFSISLITLLSDVMNEESKYGCYVIAGCYLLFTLLALAHCIQGVVTYKNTESYSAIFRSIGSGAAFFAGLVNAQFMAVMTLSAMGKTSAAEKAIGSRTIDEFVQSQRSSWVLLICAIALTILIGAAAAVRLIKGKAR